MASALVQESQDVKAEMSFAPMIDCVFQLLIFFLVCSRMKQNEDHLQVYLPTNEGPPTQPPRPQIDKPEPVFVIVKDDLVGRQSTSPLTKYSRTATYYVDSTSSRPFTDLNQLREHLKGLLLKPDTQLIIYPGDEKTNQDQKTPWKNVLGVVDAGYWAGYTKIQFRPPQNW
ncbi:MAG TPA: biopolymer transporter ExbD [Planctomycetota bacterium]|nr:biopolymer transporter ExbD [Planctomycetota bacterium]